MIAQVRPLIRAAAAALVALLGGCGYAGSGADNAFVRKAAWFDMLDGGDIRRACAPGAPDRLRLVYNQDYRSHVRIYDIDAGAPGAGGKPGDGAALAVVVVTDKPPALEIGLPIAVEGWGNNTARKALTPAELGRLVGAIERDRMLGPGPEGLRVDAFETFWTVSGCRGGKPVFDVARFPSDRFAGLTFPDALFAHDATGVAVAPPRALAAEDLPLQNWSNARETASYGRSHFTLVAGREGFRGALRL
ncbi:MAG: hypothetical protein JNK11_16690 [Alphaproteobacteria bacterium]|nr:hypothetical protein [Alphaproteobacteria bacterium]